MACMQQIEDRHLTGLIISPERASIGMILKVCVLVSPRGIRMHRELPLLAPQNGLAHNDTLPGDLSLLRQSPDSSI
jgi:hypothetical protein